MKTGAYSKVWDHNKLARHISIVKNKNLVNFVGASVATSVSQKVQKL